MNPETRRCVAISADRTSLDGFDNLERAEATALAFGHGSFDMRQGLERNPIEAVKRDAVAVVVLFWSVVPTRMPKA